MLFRSAGGQTPATKNDIQYVTIASLGNAIDYGDLAVVRALGGGTSNSIRALAMGGYTPSLSNPIDYWNINNGGTASDFGDLTVARADGIAGMSQAHGGLNDGYQGTRP